MPGTDLQFRLSPEQLLTTINARELPDLSRAEGNELRTSSYNTVKPSYRRGDRAVHEADRFHTRSTCRSPLTRVLRKMLALGCHTPLTA